MRARWMMPALAYVAGCSEEFGDPFATAGDSGGSTATDDSTTGATTTTTGAAEASASGSDGDTGAVASETAASTGEAEDGTPDGSGSGSDGGSDSGTTGAACTEIEVLFDSGFEGGHPNPDWAESASAPNKTQIVCSSGCTVDMSNLAHDGMWWAWFGGNGAIPTTDTVSQPFDAPDGGPLALAFHLQLIVPGGIGSGNDAFAVDIDGQVVFMTTDAEADDYATYALVEVDLADWADGGSHTITFTGDYVTAGGALLDDVHLVACE